MKSPASAGPSQRQLRVGEQVRHALSELLQRGEVPDDALGRAVISVSEVRMSPDLKIATAFVSPLGAKDEVAEVPAGQECGMAFANYEDIRKGDVIECFRVEMVTRTL